jgi:Uma2 family endonuclease
MPTGCRRVDRSPGRDSPRAAKCYPADAMTIASKEAPNRPDAYAIVEAVAAVLPDGYAVESIGGQIVALPRPREPHVVAVSGLTDEIGPPFRRGRGGPGGWIIFYEPECHFSRDRDFVIPDVAGWRRDRLSDHTIPKCEHDYYSQRPDWVCEVLSPGKANHDRDRVTKMALYASEGIPHYWIIDPETKTLEVHRLEADVYRMVLLTQGDKKVRAEPFDAVEIDAASLWRA